MKKESENLPILTKVGYGDYKVASLPFDKKEEAYKEIKKNWQNCETTVHYHNGKWYIVYK